MFKITRRIAFCYGHRLLDYEGKCRHLHGHNARVDVTVQREELSADGMVMDFSEVRRLLETWIDAELDHRMILCVRDPLVEVLRSHGEPLVIMDVNPTAENIAKMIYDEAHKLGLPVISVRVWETSKCDAEYRG